MSEEMKELRIELLDMLSRAKEIDGNGKFAEGAIYGVEQSIKMLDACNKIN